MQSHVRLGRFSFFSFASLVTISICTLSLAGCSQGGKLLVPGSKLVVPGSQLSFPGRKIFVVYAKNDVPSSQLITPADVEDRLVSYDQSSQNVSTDSRDIIGGIPVPAYKAGTPVFAAMDAPGAHPETKLIEQGKACIESGQNDKAIALYRQALAIEMKNCTPGHPKWDGETLDQLCSLYSDRKKTDLEEKLLKAQVALVEKVSGKNSRYLYRPLLSLADFYAEHGKMKLAMSLYERELKNQERALGSNNPQFAEQLYYTACRAYGSHNSEAGDIYLLNRYAISCLKRALSIIEPLYGPSHPTVARDLADEGMYLSMQNDDKAAAPLLARSVAIFESEGFKKIEEDDRYEVVSLVRARRDAFRNYGEVLTSLGKIEEGAKYIARAKAIEAQEDAAFAAQH